jgi:hypothetical protein
MDHYDLVSFQFVNKKLGGSVFFSKSSMDTNRFSEPVLWGKVRTYGDMLSEDEP